MKAVHCPCGDVIESETDEGLVAAVNEHIADKHPEMEAKSPEEVLAMAHEH